MGKILLYPAGRACQSLLAKEASSDNIATHNYKNINGQQKNTLKGVSANVNNILIYNGITAYVSADTESDFSTDLSSDKSYAKRDISNIGYTRNATDQTGGKVYTIQATNNGSSEISVGSIKFTKTLSPSSASLNSEFLLWGYFLDSPVTIGVGETKTFALNFDT